MKNLFFVSVLLLSSNFVYSQWITDWVPYTTASDLTYVNVVDTGIVWVLGSESHDTAYVMVKSPDYWWYGGLYNDLPVGYLYTAIGGVDSVKAFVGNENGKIFETTNKGINWTLILDAGDGALVTGIKFSKIYKNIGYIFCDPPNNSNFSHVYRTTDFGNSWVDNTFLTSNSYFPYWRSECVTDSTHAWMGLINTSASQSKLAFSTTNGVSWHNSVYIQNSNCVQAVGFKSDNNFGLAIFTNNNFWSLMYSSSDGGQNWTVLNSFQPKTLFETSLISIPQTSTWYYLYPDLDSNISTIYKSVNDGNNWTRMTIDNPQDMISYMDAVRFGNKVYAYAVSRFGKIYSLYDTTTTIGIKPIGSKISKFFYLSQNYPNPFNPTTKIKFDIPLSRGATEGRGVSTSLIIYDILGREVATLVNEKLNPGTYKVEFNGANYPSGVYFYKLKSGSYTVTKKMVLVK